MDSHEFNRKKVCILCLSNNKNVRPISRSVRTVIQEKFLQDIDERKWYYPTSICTSCRVMCTVPSETWARQHLYKYKYDYKQVTRCVSICHCEVCSASKVVEGRNLPGVTPKKFKPGRPKKVLSDTIKVVRICKVCLTEIGRGRKHGCNSSRRTENLSIMLKEKNSSQKSAEAAVSEFLAEKVSSSGINCVLFEFYSTSILFYFISTLYLGSNNIRLSNRRGKQSVYHKTSPVTTSNDQNKISSKNMFKLKISNSLSMRKTLGNESY